MSTLELRQWMERHGLTYDSAATLLGMPRRTFARYVSGEKEIDKLLRYACAAIDKKIDPL